MRRREVVAHRSPFGGALDAFGVSGGRRSEGALSDVDAAGGGAARSFGQPEVLPNVGAQDSEFDEIVTRRPIFQAGRRPLWGSSAVCGHLPRVHGAAFESRGSDAGFEGSATSQRAHWGSGRHPLRRDAGSLRELRERE